MLKQVYLNFKDAQNSYKIKYINFKYNYYMKIYKIINFTYITLYFYLILKI